MIVKLIEVSMNFTISVVPPKANIANWSMTISMLGVSFLHGYIKYGDISYSGSRTVASRLGGKSPVIPLCENHEIGIISVF